MESRVRTVGVDGVTSENCRVYEVTIIGVGDNSKETLNHFNLLPHTHTHTST